MAKQTVGPAIRYLDKAVLALCGVVFLYFLAMYGVMSPNKAGEPGAEQFGPGEIDLAIREEAERLRERLLSGEAPATPTPSPMPVLTEFDSVLAMANVSGEIPSPVPPGLSVFSEGPEDTPPTVNLVATLPLGKPEVIVGRSGVHLASPGEFKPGEPQTAGIDADIQDANWVTIYARFDRAAQESQFREAGHDRYAVAVALGMDVERRMQLPGGGWSEWSPVNAVRRMNVPTLAPPTVQRSAKGVYEVPEAERQAVDAFYNLITDGTNNEAQCELLRPLFPNTAYGDQWTYPKPEGLDVLAMDADFQTTARCRYPECAGAEIQIATDAKFDDLMKLADAELTAENFDVARKYATAARDAAQRDTNTEKNTSERDVKKATELLSKIDLEEAKAKAALAGKELQPIQLVWAHDAAAGSVLSGRTYAYRARLRLYNMYCGRPALLNDPMQAAIVEQVGDWSEASDPVAIEPDTWVFMKRDKANAQEVTVEVFKWFAGELLMRPFAVTTGNIIGEVKTVETPPGGEKRSVDFGTGVTVVDLDFRHKATLPDRKTRRLQEVDTVSMIYVDASGNLHQQLLEFDKNSQTYSDLNKRKWEGK